MCVGVIRVDQLVACAVLIFLDLERRKKKKRERENSEQQPWQLSLER